MVDYKKEIEKMINDIKAENPKREIDFREDYVLDVNGTKVDVSILDIKEPIEKDDEKTNINKMQILFKTKEGYVLIAEVTEDNEIDIKEDGMKQAGLDERIGIGLHNKIELREKDERERSINTGNEENNKNNKKKETTEEKNNGNKEKDDTQKPQLLKKQSNWIKLDLSAEVVKGRTLGEILGSREGEEVYIAPGKDTYDYSIVSGNEKSGFKALDTLERTEGRAPNQEIMSIESNMDMDVHSKQSLTMFKCKGRNDEGFTISKLGNGNDQVRIEYWRRAYKDLYMSSIVPQERADRGIDKPNKEIRELMSKKYYSRMELTKKMDTHEEITKEVNKQNLPNEVNPASDGIQIEELDRETFRERLIENIVKDEMGTGKQMPGREGYIREKAEKMADKILDENKDYEVAKRETFGERDEGGQTPDEKRNKGE